MVFFITILPYPSDAKNVDSKSSNSAVVSKLLGKYNRKSFISTGKIVVPPTVDENESKEDISQNNDTAADHVIAPHATSEVSSTNKPATLPPPPYEQVSQEAPPSYEAIHSLPATPSGGASLETFLNEHAMQVEDHPDIPSPMNSGRHQEDSQVHFNRSDLMSKYPSIQREPSNAHETSKHHHYSRLGAAFVNESSLNSLMGRGRGGRFGGRSGRGFSSSV